MPVTGKVKQTVSKELIFSKVSEYDVYRFYLGRDFTLGSPILSPFRKEENPSFGIICTEKGNYIHRDFSDGHTGNCIDFVMHLYHLSFYQALVKIDGDLGLGIGVLSDRKEYHKMMNEATPHRPKKHTLIQAVTKKFNKEEIAYWNQYHIDLQDLKKNDVYSVKKIFLNGEAFLLPVGDLVFGYLFGDRWKIYRPLAGKKDKWMTNTRNTTISGLGRLPMGTERGFVTKSKKDEMVLGKFLPSVCSAQNESRYAISPDNIQLLQSSCKEVYINFDNDEVGVQSSKFYNQFGFKWVNCPKNIICDGSEAKDFADLARYHGLNTVINHFKEKNLI